MTKVCTRGVGDLSNNGNAIKPALKDGGVRSLACLSRVGVVEIDDDPYLAPSFGA